MVFCARCCQLSGLLFVHVLLLTGLSACSDDSDDANEGASSTGGATSGATGSTSVGGATSTAAGTTSTSPVVPSTCTVTTSGSKGTFVDTRDGQTYDCVVIGSQTWMAENLNYGSNLGVTSATTPLVTGQKYCFDDGFVDSDTQNTCDYFGGLYQWHIAMGLDSTYLTTQYSASGNIQGVCPAGWHLPSKTEFSTLTNAATCTALDDTGATVTVDGNTTATLTTLTLDTGYCLKANGSAPTGYPLRWAQNPDNNDAGGNGSDAWGWTALGTGARYPAGSTIAGSTYTEALYTWGPRYEGSSLTGYRGMWWTSTESDASTANYGDIADDSWRMGANNSAPKTEGLAVRCVQD